jgi:hypothetical protein
MSHRTAVILDDRRLHSFMLLGVLTKQIFNNHDFTFSNQISLRTSARIALTSTFLLQALLSGLTKERTATMSI